MCRIEERVYIGAEGHRSMFEERFPCDKSRNGKLCSTVKKKTSEYHTKSGSFSRDNTPSPGNPPTPTGTGAYVVQQRRPSMSSGRPSTRHGLKIAPEITINFNSKKDGGKRGSGVTVSTKPHKRPSLVTSPIESGDLIDDFPGSDGSHTIRTGFPEAPVPAPTAFGHPDSYMPPLSHAYHHHQTSSNASFHVPSQTPSLYVTSDPDYESPDSRRSARHAPTIVQHQNPAMPPSSPSRASAMKPSVPYRTSVVAPRVSAHDAHTSDNLFPLDHGDLADRSASSHASSGAPENTRKGKDRDERRRKQDDERRREDERNRQVADEAARENAKQVRFELDRPAARERERTEKAFAEKEKDRAQAREDARRRERKEREKKEREEEEARQRKKEKRSSTIKHEAKPAPRTRRASMTQGQMAEQRHLLAAEQRRMEDEKQAAIARERDEQNALLRQQQDTREYFDPRGGNRSLDRRGSISRQPPPMPSAGLARSNSRRTSIHQSNPPALNTQLAQDYPTRPPNTRQKTGPPVSFPANFNQTQGYERPPSTRRSSSAQEPPPSARIRRDSASSTANPFVLDPVLLSPSLASSDPWGLRNIQSTLPNGPTRSPRSTTLHQRGHHVIAQAQQATRALYQDERVFDDDSSDEYAAYAARPRRKH